MEAISPTPDDVKQSKKDYSCYPTKQDRKQEKTELLETMNKMDINLNTLETELKRLKRKEQQLLSCKFSPQTTQLEESSTRNRSTIEIVYIENKVFTKLVYYIQFFIKSRHI